MAKLELNALATRCPACDEEIDVPITVEIVDAMDSPTMTLRLDPDMTEVWAHAWTHDIEETE